MRLLVKYLSWQRYFPVNYTTHGWEILQGCQYLMFFVSIEARLERNRSKMSSVAWCGISSATCIFSSRRLQHSNTGTALRISILFYQGNLRISKSDSPIPIKINSLSPELAVQSKPKPPPDQQAAWNLIRRRTCLSTGCHWKISRPQAVSSGREWQLRQRWRDDGNEHFGESRFEWNSSSDGQSLM